MKLFRFNKSALLKALRLCALLLMYAASQTALQAQFNPTTGTAGNDNVTASGSFTGSFLGGGGSDTITINLGANVTGDAESVIEINAGSVTNNGTLSNTYNGPSYGIHAESDEDGNFSLFNNGLIYVESTGATNADAFGSFSSVYSINNNVSITVTNSGYMGVLAGTSSSHSWAYGSLIATESQFGDSLINYTNNSELFVTASDSGYSWAAGVYIYTGGSPDNYGDFTVNLENNDTIHVQSGNSSSSNSGAYGIYASQSSQYGDVLITGTNSGGIEVSSGSSASGHNSTAAAVSLNTASEYASSTVQFTNDGGMFVTSGNADEDDGSSNATGISVDNQSNQYRAQTSIINTGGILASSGYGYNSNAFGIHVNTEGDLTDKTVSNNSGYISAYSSAAEYSSATGISVSSAGTYNNITVNNNRGYILVESSYGYASAAVGISASSSGAYDTITINNSGMIDVESNSAYSSSAYGIFGSSEGYVESAVTVRNTGSIYVQTDDESFDSIVYGISALSRSQYQAVTNVSNGETSAINVSSGYGYNSTTAYGISASSYSNNGEAATTVTNAGRIFSNSTYSPDGTSSAYGIWADAFGNDYGTVTVSSTGNITVHANYYHEYVENDTYASGISANSASNYIAESTVSNSGSVYVSATSAEDATRASAISALADGDFASSSTVINNAGGELSVYASNGDSGNRAYGIHSGSENSYITQTTVTNNGTIQLETEDGYENMSFGISAYTTDSAYAETTVTNNGSIDTESNFSFYATNYGITASSSGNYAETRVTNSGAINAYSNYSTYTDVRGIFATSDGNSSSYTMVNNSGTITASIGYYTSIYNEVAGIYASSNGQTSVINTGTISVSGYNDVVGIYAEGTIVDVTNTGGTVESSQEAIVVDADNAGLLTLNGISRISGLMLGAQGNDTLELNLLGLSTEEAAELETYLQGIGSGYGTFTVAGQTYEIEGWENFTLEATSFAALLANNPGLKDFAKALDNLDGDIGPELALLLSEIAFGGGAEEKLSQLAGQNLIDAINGINLQQANQLTQDLLGRAAALRNGPDGIDLSGFNVHDSSLLAQADLIGNQLTNLGMFADAGNPQINDFPVDSGIRPAPEVKRWGAWMNGNGTIADQETADGITGYQSKSARATLGVDFKATTNLAVGILGGYSKDEAKGSGMDVDADSAIVGVYAAWAEKGWHVEGLAAYVHSIYDTDRILAGTVNSGETNGNAGVAAINGGYDFKFNDLTVGPMAGLQYSHAVVDGYTETGPLALNIGDNTVESLQTILGAQLRYQMNLSKFKITPQVHAAWHHEFMNDNNDVSTGFVNSPGVGVFNVDGREPERDYGVVGANVAMVIRGLDLITFYAGYNAQVGQSSYISHSINGGLKVSF